MGDGTLPRLESDDARVRFVLQRELETITHYELLAADAQSPEMKQFFLHLAAEEKEHVAEATAVLRRLDPGQDTHFQKPYEQSHFAGGQKPAAAAAPAPLEVTAASPAPSAPPPGPLADLTLPRDLRRAPYVLPAPPSETAGQFTVGALRKRGSAP